MALTKGKPRDITFIVRDYSNSKLQDYMCTMKTVTDKKNTRKYVVRARKKQLDLQK